MLRTAALVVMVVGLSVPIDCESNTEKKTVMNAFADSGNLRETGTLTSAPLFGANGVISTHHLSLPGRFQHSLNLILNPSFTNGFTSWTATGPSILDYYTFYGPSYIFQDAAALGAACGGTNDVVSQTVTTVIGQTYNVQFHWLNGAGTSSVRVTFGAASLLSIDNVSRSTWATSNSFVIASATSTTLRFQGCNTADYFMFTQVVVNPVSATPSPSLTRSISPSLSSSRSFSPSVSTSVASRSVSPSGVSLTASASFSVSRSVSPTATLSTSLSVSPTSSMSLTASRSFTPSNSVSPSLSSSATASRSVSATSSASTTRTQSVSKTPVSVTPSPTKTSANLVVDGKFSHGFSGWSGSGSYLYESSFLYSHSGNGVIEMGASCNNMDRLTEHITTVVGATYHMSFWWANTVASPSNILVTFGGTTVLSRTNVAQTTWAQVNVNVVATSTNTAVTFQACNSNGWFLFTQVAVSLVPSASASVSQSRTSTPTVSATSSVSPSQPASTSQTPSASATRSQTATVSPTGSQTRSASTSSSQTPSATQSASSSASQTTSGSATVSPSLSTSSSPSQTASQSSTPSQTTSQSSTTSVTTSRSSTPSQTGSPTESTSESASTTETATASVTPSRTTSPISHTPSPSQSQVVVSLTLAPRLLGPGQTATLTATIVSGLPPTAPVLVVVTHAGLGVMHEDYNLSSATVTIPAFQMSGTITVTCITTKPSVILAFYSSYVVPGSFIEPYYLAVNLTNEMPSTSTSPTPTPVSKTPSSSMSQSLSSTGTRTHSVTPSNTYTFRASTSRSSSVSRTSSLSASMARSSSPSRSPTNTPTTGALVGLTVSSVFTSPNSNVVLTATLTTGPLTVPVQLFFSLSGGAVRGVDYLVPALFVTIAPGSTTGTQVIQVLNVATRTDIAVYLTTASHATVDPRSFTFFDVVVQP